MKRFLFTTILSFFICLSQGQQLDIPLKKWNKQFNGLIRDLGYSKSGGEKVNEEILKVLKLEQQQHYLEAAEYGAAIHKVLNDNAFLKVLRNTEFYAFFLNHISCDYNKIGAYPQALYYGLEEEKCWDELGKRKNDKHIKLMHIEAICNLASFYYTGNDNWESEKWIDKGLKLTKGFEEYEYFYYQLLNTKATLYDKIGKKEEALKIEEEINHNSSIIVNQWRINLVQFQYNCGQVDIAISAITQLINEYKSKGLNETNEYASLLARLGIYNENKDIEKSISLTKEAIKILKTNNSTLSSDYAQYLSNLAEYFYRSGSKNDAVATEKEAYNIWSRIHNVNSPSSLLSLRKLAIYQFYNNQKKDAEKNIITATSYFNENIRYSMKQSNEIRQMIWNGCQGWYRNTILLLASNIQSDSLYGVAYDAALLSKGLLLNTEQTLKDMADKGGTQIRALYDDWQFIKQLSELPNTSNEANRLKKEAEEKERLFISECRGLKELDKKLSITWQDVHYKLGVDDVAIEFCSYKQGYDIKYIAFIIKKGMSCPQMIPLFNEKQLQTIKNIYIGHNGSMLIWQPIADYLQNVKNIYFSACGELHNIAIESLPHWSENCLMSDKWHIYRLSSTRELIIARNSPPIKKAVVYGGINYNASIDMLANNNKIDSKYQMHLPHDFDSVFQSGFRNLDTKLLTNGNVPYNRDLVLNPSKIITSKVLRDGFGDLPGTKVEAEEAYQLFKQTGIQATLYEGSQATEGTMKNLSGRKVNLLHIGTHGFYYQEKEAKYHTHLAFLKQDYYQGQLTEDKVLSNSGLLFSGANNAWKGNKTPAGFEDGILTAKEISQMDLIDLDLVVLAACESGLGEITGEGVYGLQRGFKKAGANSLLMSLWKVDDDATCLLMSQFYKHLISGLSKSESLRQAQKYTRKKYPSPEHWAAFILLDAIN